MFERRRKAEAALQGDLAREGAVIYGGFELLDEIIFALKGHGEVFPMTCTIILAKARRLAAAIFSLLLDGSNNEAGAIARVLHECEAVLWYVGFNPARAEELRRCGRIDPGRAAKRVWQDVQVLKESAMACRVPEGEESAYLRAFGVSTPDEYDRHIRPVEEWLDSIKGMRKYFSAEASHLSFSPNATAYLVDGRTGDVVLEPSYNKGNLRKNLAILFQLLRGPIEAGGFCLARCLSMRPNILDRINKWSKEGWELLWFYQ